MNVLSLNSFSYVRGGVERCFLDWNALLRQKGHTVVSMAAAHDMPQDPQADVALPPVDLESPSLGDGARFVYNRRAAAALDRVLAEGPPGGGRFDVAHLHVYYSQFGGAILPVFRKHGVPVVQTLHEYKIVCPVSTLVDGSGRLCEACGGHAFWHAVARRCNRGSLARSAASAAESYVTRAMGAVSRVDHFIAVSAFVRDKVVSLGVPAEKVTTVYNFTAPATPAEGPGGYVLFFGRIETVKGIFTLLDAAERLPELPFVIAGDGHQRDALAAEVARRGLAHVRLVGFQHGAKLDALVRGAICTAVPSEWYEPSGQTIYETLARGRPLVVTAMGGMPELVRDGVDGFVVPPAHPAALADKLRWLAEHPDEAMAMGQSALERARTDFAPDTYYAQVMALYRRLAPNAALPAPPRPVAAPVSAEPWDGGAVGR